MKLNVRQAIASCAAILPGLALSAALLTAAGCSRQEENAHGDLANTPPASEDASRLADDARRPQDSPPPSTEPPVIRQTNATSPGDRPESAEDTIDPRRLEPVEQVPAHDALLAKLETNGGDLGRALKEVTSRIEHSAGGDVILLNLSGPHVTDATLEKLKALDRLLVLDIWDAPITDDGLAHLSGMTQLRALGLRGTKVTNDGLRHLSRLSSLKELNLTQTAVTDAGMKHLTGLKSLHALGLDDTIVTGTGVNELQAALPLCRIAW